MYARRKSTRDRQGLAESGQLPQVGRVTVETSLANPCDEEEISLHDVWRILRRNWVMLLGLVLLGGLASAAAALLMTPLYRAEVTLAPVNDLDDSRNLTAQLGEFGGLAALAGIKLDHKDRRVESMATLRSRQFNQQFIEDRNLRPVLFADKWDAQHERWKADVAAEDIPTPWDAYEKFRNSVRHIREDRGTGIVTLSMEWRDPDTAARWANGIVDSVNASLRQKAVENSNRAITYLQEQLSRTTVVDLQQVVHQLIESEMKKIILADINKEFAFKVIDPAVAPEEPFRPKMLPMVTLGALLGLIAGVIVALLRNALHSDKVQARRVDAAVTPPVARGAR